MVTQFISTLLLFTVVLLLTLVLLLMLRFLPTLSCICIKGPAVVVIVSFFSTIALLIPAMLPLLGYWVVLMPVHIKTGNLDISPSKEISPLLIMSKEETIKTNRNHFCYKHPVSWVCSYSEDLFLQAAP